MKSLSVSWSLAEYGASVMRVAPSTSPFPSRRSSTRSLNSAFPVPRRRNTNIWIFLIGFFGTNAPAVRSHPCVPCVQSARTPHSGWPSSYHKSR